MKILFVCKSNIGRSQMAEGLFLHLTSNHIAHSAGTSVPIENENQLVSEIDTKLVNAMTEEGIDVAEKVRNQLTSELVSNSDRVVSLISFDELPDYLKSSEELEIWDVSDAAGDGQEFYNNLRDIIKLKILDFIKKMDSIS
jgi:protein-tyrosine-phosphatase